MSDGLFSKDESDLIEAAKLILADGVSRLKSRDALFPTNRNHSRSGRRECREARSTLTDKLVADYGSLRFEVAVAVLIDAQGRLIAIEQFPQGKATSVELSPRILANFILKHGASAVLLAHNHPSGDNTPSAQDVSMTERLTAWLKFMDVDLIDHLVLNGEEASSIVGHWL